MARLPTDSSEFKRFHLALTRGRPDYAPHYLKVAAGDTVKRNEGGEPVDKKDNPVSEDSPNRVNLGKKAIEKKHARITEVQAVKLLERGLNVGIEAETGDNWVIMDVDNPEVVKLSDVKPTLTTRSRKRAGYHYFYIASNPEDTRLKNLGITGVGEIRSGNQYVLAPGSWVDTFDIPGVVPEAEADNAGKYTLESNAPIAHITFDELPKAFRDAIEAAQATNTEADKIATERHVRQAARKAAHPESMEDEGSAFFDLQLSDVIHIPKGNPGMRFKNPLHPGGTGTSAGISDRGYLQCFSHSVTHTGLSALAVLAGVADCESAGQGFGNSTVGASTVDYTDGATLWKMWSYAIKEGILPKDDPVMWDALVWYAIDQDVLVQNDLIDGYKLPPGAVSRTKAIIKSKEGIEILNIGTKKPKAKTATTPETPKAEPNQTDLLIELGKKGTIFFHTPDDTCYAAVKLETGGSAIYPLNEKSRQFKRILKHRYYNATGKAPASEPLKAAIGVLESIAAFEGETIELHNRVAWHNGNICYDMTNSNYEAIEITPQGWGMMPHGHIIFRRFGHQIPQVQPISGGDVWRLYQFVNVPKTDRLLDMVHLISCLVPEMPHPIPITTGEHGAAKTTACKMKKALIDPSDLDVIALQPNEERMVQLMYHHWFIIFDNVTYLQQWQSDMFCRACTGEGTVRRTLYTNDDDTIFKYKRCIGLNGINNAATKPDLLDRAIFLNHEPIPKDRRIEEKVLFERFNEVKPEILGGMFDVLSKALRIYPTIDLKEKPRMADFAVWGCAIATALGRTQEEFLDAYYENIGRINRTALEESPVGLCLISLMETCESWEGSPTELHTELEMYASVHSIDVKSKFWVKTPRTLGKRLRLITPNLREVGITVETVRTHEGREYRIANRLYSETKTTQTTQTTRNRRSIAVSGGEPKRHVTTQTTRQTTRVNEDAGSLSTQNDVIDTEKSKRHGQNQQQEASPCRCDVCDVSVTSHDMGVCGKCGCELSGQTFQGPAGLGLICAECQAELDRTSGHIERTDEQMIELIKGAIYRLGFVEGIHEFTAAEVLMELPKGTGATTEKIEKLLDGNAGDLKIDRTDGGKWRQVKA